MQYFPYGPKEIAYLKGKDKKLGAAIDRIGIIERQINLDIFAALVDSIISQQISSKAADTVQARICSLVGSITPKNIAAADLELIQQCGMSMRKAVYIKEAAEAVLNNKLDIEELRILPDKEVIKKLRSLKGIGQWTAEMLLLFSLCRPDVVSYGDLAIRRGMMNLYQLKELPKERFNYYRKRYSPYGSVASLYLWKMSVE